MTSTARIRLDPRILALMERESGSRYGGSPLVPLRPSDYLTRAAALVEIERFTRPRVRCPQCDELTRIMETHMDTQRPPGFQPFDVCKTPGAPKLLAWALECCCMVFAAQYMLWIAPGKVGEFRPVDTTTKEGDEMDTTQTQTAELRRKLQEARNRREMDEKIDQAGKLVTDFDIMAVGSIIRFDKMLPKHGGGVNGYTYVAIKVDADSSADPVWYTTGSETGPLTADDLAAFMLAGNAIERYDIMAVSDTEPLLAAKSV